MNSPDRRSSGFPLSRRDFLRAAALGFGLLAGLKPQASEGEPSSSEYLWPQYDIANKDGQILTWDNGSAGWSQPSTLSVYGIGFDLEINPGKRIDGCGISQDQEIIRKIVPVAFIARSLNTLAKNNPTMRQYLDEKGLTEEELNLRASSGDWRREVARQAPDIFKDAAWYNAIPLGELDPNEASRYRKLHSWLINEGTLVMPDGGRFNNQGKTISRDDLEARVAEWNNGDLSNLIYWGDELSEEVDSRLGFKAIETAVQQNDQLISTANLKWLEQMAPRVVNAVLRYLPITIPEGLSTANYSNHLGNSDTLPFIFQILPEDTLVVGDEGEPPDCLSTYWGGVAGKYESPDKPWLFVGASSPPIKILENMAVAVADALTIPQASGDWPSVAKQTSNSLLYGAGNHGADDPWLGIYPDSIFGPLHLPFGPRLPLLQASLPRFGPMRVVV